MDLIIPAAGSASRMGGLPKFLLPIDDEATSLIARHIENAAALVSQIWIPTRPEYVTILETLLLRFKNVTVFDVETKTMTESLQTVLTQSKSRRFSVVMPDTFFWGELPYRYLLTDSANTKVAAWEIRRDQMGKLGQIQIQESEGKKVITDIRDKNSSCQWPFAWGAMSINRNVLESADPLSVPGIILENQIKEQNYPEVMQMDGEYFDCGTTQEYFNLVRKISSTLKNQ